MERYRKGERKHPPQAIEDRIDAAVRARWQPQVRKRRQKQAATTAGITVETRARFGYTAPVGTTDDGRFRRLTVHLPPTYAQRLFDARQAGASDQQMRQIIAEGFQGRLLPRQRKPRHDTLRRHPQRHRLPRPRLLTPDS
ncbi:telomere-protecting terminal protein Tpg [Streptomyces nigra]|uniref:telomere-protecting terminal protein Tpg n=1 Tax=Streptomyces nigra TaxID=1827580 RepID=UPI00381BE0A8